MHPPIQPCDGPFLASRLFHVISGDSQRMLAAGAYRYGWLFYQLFPKCLEHQLPSGPRTVREISNNQDYQISQAAQLYILRKQRTNNQDYFLGID